MSILRGEPASELSLESTTERLAASARQAARPGLHWIAGVAYQGFNLGWTFGVVVAAPLVSSLPGDGGFGSLEWGVRLDLLKLVTADSWPWLLLLLPIFARLVSGLAALALPEDWYAPNARGRPRKAPGGRRLWAAARGLVWATVGLWLQVLIMMFGAVVIFLGPTRLFMEMIGLARDDPFGVLLTGASLALIAFYGFVLSVLFQISLHSLVQNRRGVASALLHGWRIAKNSPIATARATIVDALLYFGSWATSMALVIGAVYLSGMASPMLLISGTCVFVLEGVVGGTRCAYWARTYHVLGGVSIREGAPGA